MALFFQEFLILTALSLPVNFPFLLKTLQPENAITSLALSFLGVCDNGQGLSGQPFPSAKLLLLDERAELDHLTVCFYLSHVLLDGEMLALEQSVLLSLAHIKRCESIVEEIELAIVIIALEKDVIRHGPEWAPLTSVLDLILLCEVVVIDLDSNIIVCFESELLWDYVLFSEVKCAHRPFLVAFEEV